MSLFSPILREPSLMLAVVDLNGSGAATLESFWVVLAQLEQRGKFYCNTFSHLVQTMVAGGGGG
jgi:hypothetical protein